MNLKLNNEDCEPPEILEPLPLSPAEERRRTGRYVAIMVGIALVCLATYHAWVRKVPVLASLLVPALIMLLYIAWVLYTASRDKRKAYDVEMCLGLVSAAGPDHRTPTRNAEVASVEVSRNLPPATRNLPLRQPSPGPAVPSPGPTVPSPVPKTSTPKNPNSPKEFRRCYSIS